MEMDEIVEDMKPVGEVKIEDKNSLGLLALEYSSPSSDDEDHDMESMEPTDFKSPEEECIKNEIVPKEETESCKKEKLGENEVNLFEFVASLNNSEVPCGLAEDTDLNSTTDKSDEINAESAVEVNLLEYVANLNKMQLPGNVSAIVNSDFKTVAIQEKVECANEVPDKVEQFKDYRSQPAVVDLSSSEDSESDSSSSSDSDSSDSSGEDAAVVNIDDKDEENEDDAPETNTNSGSKVDLKIRKEKSEFDNLPPIEDLQISVPEVLADPMGEVAWFAEQMVVVKPKPEKPTLNLETVLFLEKGSRVLGRVFDVFGPVKEPYYCVRFNNEDHIKESNIKIGMTVYYWPNSPYTTLVFLSELSKMRGTDTIDYSEHPEFSDDEEENAYFAAVRRNSQAQKNVQKPNTENAKKPRLNEVQPARPRRPNQPRQRYPNAEQQGYQQMYMPRQPHYMMQQAPIAPCPPMMSQYPMNQYYRPNTYSPYSFGYQNWPPRAPFYNNYPTHPPPPPPNDAPGSPYNHSQHNPNQTNGQS